MSTKDPNGNELPFDVWMTARTTINRLSLCLVLAVVMLTASLAYNAVLYREKREPIPVFFALDDANKQVVKIERMDGYKTIQQSKLLKEWAFRQYVLNREIINHMDEKERFRQVRLMSNDSVWLQFQNQVDPRLNKESVLSDKRFTREINIDNAFPVVGVKNVWRIEFTVNDTYRERPNAPLKMFAIIQYREVESKVSFDDRFLNLSGLEILSYQLNSL